MIRNSRFLVLVIAVALVAGTIVGWNLKVFAIEQSRSDTQREMCESLYDSISNLIDWHASPPSPQQITDRSKLFSRDSGEQVSAGPSAQISFDASLSNDPRLAAAQVSNLRTLVSSYGLSCNRSKKVKLQNDLEQAISERLRRDKEHQSQ
ncbi:MAG: hypothetical protein AAGG45_01830 [Pseudomonadota bacterium]